MVNSQYLDNDLMVPHAVAGGGTPVESGNVVQCGDGRAGVNVGRTIEAGSTGVLQTHGRYRFPALASGAIAAAAVLYWDPSAKQATAVATSNFLLGKAFAAKADGATEIVVTLNV